MRRRGGVPGLVAAAAVAVLATLAGCDSSGGASLPGCASGVPVPGGVELVESRVEEGTCLLTFASDDSLRRVRRAWRAALREEGWRFSVRRSGARSTFLQLEEPRCGLVMVFAAGSPRVAGSVSRDRTPTLVSMLPCGVLVGPDGAPRP